MAWNDFKWLLLCSASFLLVLNGQKRSGFLDIWPKMAEKVAKYAKIKFFDTLIKIESLVLTGTLSFFLSFFFSFFDSFFLSFFDSFFLSFFDSSFLSFYSFFLSFLSILSFCLFFLPFPCFPCPPTSASPTSRLLVMFFLSSRFWLFNQYC